MPNRVTVLGSMNVDTTYQIERMPQPGETLATTNKSSAAGGKGANQAVAAVRAGATTAFIGKVGKDSSGEFMIESLNENNIDTTNISVDPLVGTGSAAIMLDANGQNSILVYGGANHKLSPADIENAAETIKNSDFLVSQFETPQDATLAAFKIAKENDVLTVLNPAPASEIDHELLKYTDLIIPNETESELLTGIKITDEASMLETAAHFKKLGAKNLIITIGSKGAFYVHEDEYEMVPAFKVKAVDTTAAGDTFIGALTSQLKTDFSNLKDALVYAQRSSSITVQGLGAMPSIPTYDEVMAASRK
ncbi:ribokinase [Ligilactobacillus ceti]|nr:ribokinase [Ligilactobacillus ceti]